MSKIYKTLEELKLLDYDDYLYTNKHHDMLYENFKLIPGYTLPDHKKNLKPFCVYITLYLGNIFPPKYSNTVITPYLYIGSTYVEKVLLIGYNGSVSSTKYKILWEHERLVNPHLFKTYILCFTDTLNEAIKIESDIHILNNVKNNPLYLNMAHASGNFIWANTEDTKEERSKRVMGEKNPMYGKRGPDNPNYGKPLSEERKRKIGEKAKIHSKGAKNSNAAIFHFINPFGILYEVAGGFHNFCIEHNISESRIRQYIGKGQVPPIITNHYVTEKCRNAVGWSVEKIGKVRDN
jgi:hypothetical protein